MVTPICEDELLTSWLVRLARANSARLHVFTVDLFGRKNPERPHFPMIAHWHRDLDRTFKPDDLEELARRTELPVERVRRTTLEPLERRLTARTYLGTGVARWLLPIGVRQLVRLDYGLQFCPHCLREDAVPYFRRVWRLAFLTICPVHWTPMLDRCPACRSPVNFARREFGGDGHRICRSPITECFSCGFDLREASAEWGAEAKRPVRNREGGHRRTGRGPKHRSRSSVSATRLYYFQAWLLEGLVRDWFDLSDLRATRLSGRVARRNWVKKGRSKDLSQIRKRPTERVSSGDFFDGMRQVVKLLASDCGPNKSLPWTAETFAFKPRNREVVKLCHVVRCKVGVRKLVSGESRASDAFERMPVEERRIVMMMVAYTMLDWPNRFVGLCEQTGVTASRVTMDREKTIGLPRWFAEPVNERLNRIADYPNLVHLAN